MSNLNKKRFSQKTKTNQQSQLSVMNPFANADFSRFSILLLSQLKVLKRTLTWNQIEDFQPCSHSLHILHTLETNVTVVSVGMDVSHANLSHTSCSNLPAFVDTFLSETLHSSRGI